MFLWRRGFPGPDAVKVHGNIIRFHHYAVAMKATHGLIKATYGRECVGDAVMPVVPAMHDLLVLIAMVSEKFHYVNLNIAVVAVPGLAVIKCGGQSERRPHPTT